MSWSVINLQYPAEAVRWIKGEKSRSLGWSMWVFPQQCNKLEASGWMMVSGGIAVVVSQQFCFVN